MENTKMNETNNKANNNQTENRPDNSLSAVSNSNPTLVRQDSTINPQYPASQDPYYSNNTGPSSYYNSGSYQDGSSFSRGSSTFSYGGGYNSYNNNQNSSYYNNQPGFMNDPRQQQGPPGQQMPPVTFRTDFWGAIQGFNCVLNILYAGSGLVNYGKIFMHMSLKIVKFVCGKSLGFIMKITGLNFLRRLLFSANKLPWTDEFGTSSILTSVWSDSELEKATKTTLSGKFVQALRICSLLGTLLFFFLRRKMANGPIYAEPIDMNRMNPEIIEVNQITQEIMRKSSKSVMENESEQMIKNEDVQTEGLITANSQTEFVQTEVVADIVENELPIARLAISKAPAKDYIEMKDMTKTPKIERRKSQEAEEIKYNANDNQGPKIFSSFEEMKKKPEFRSRKEC